MINDIGGDEVDAVRLARKAGIIFNKEPVAKIEITSLGGTDPPSLAVVDHPEWSNLNSSILRFNV